ncbi:hypothetical protein GCM10017788_72460 [Amycolatopsis acidiphila]|nr:hypothetical protein GCM10017788_72460 [Amycolatopsis acidiphila]
MLTSAVTVYTTTYGARGTPVQPGYSPVDLDTRTSLLQVNGRSSREVPGEVFTAQDVTVATISESLVRRVFASAGATVTHSRPSVPARERLR